MKCGPSSRHRLDLTAATRYGSRWSRTPAINDREPQSLCYDDARAAGKFFVDLATGTSSLGEPFERRTRFSFFIATAEPEGPGQPEPNPGDRKRPDLVVDRIGVEDLKVSCPDGPDSCVTTVEVVVKNAGGAPVAEETRAIAVLDPKQQVTVGLSVPPLDPGHSESFTIETEPAGNCLTQTAPSASPSTRLTRLRS